MTGLAVLGVVLTKRFSWRLEGMLSDTVRAALSPDRLDAIKQNPRVLFDLSTTDTLRAEFAEAGVDGARMIEGVPACGTVRSKTHSAYLTLQ